MAAGPAAAGTAATSAAAAMPQYISAETRGPAIALVSGENGFSVPKVSIDTGAVVANAASPIATAPDTGGGSQRRRRNSNEGAANARPATARYDSLNDSAWTLAGSTTTAALNVSANTGSGGCGRSRSIAALAIQNMITALATAGEAPTTYR